jgi:hypothetical protein
MKCESRIQEWLSLLEDAQAPFGERYEAASLIAEKASHREIENIHIPVLYRAMVKFWQGLGIRPIDRSDGTLFRTRKNLAGICSTISLQLPGGTRFFKNFPRIGKVEGPSPLKKNEILSGSLRNAPGWLSIYEFHWEYPIEGFGVQKDKISVITEKGIRIPLLDWCINNDLIIFCNRCGLEITYDVSRNCPWIRIKYAAQ